MAPRLHVAWAGFTKPRNSEGKLTARSGGTTVTNRYLASPAGFEVS